MKPSPLLTRHSQLILAYRTSGLGARWFFSTSSAMAKRSRLATGRWRLIPIFSEHGPVVVTSCANSIAMTRVLLLSTRHWLSKQDTQSHGWDEGTPFLALRTTRKRWS